MTRFWWGWCVVGEDDVVVIVEYCYSTAQCSKVQYCNFGVNQSINNQIERLFFCVSVCAGRMVFSIFFSRMIRDLPTNRISDFPAFLLLV